MTDETPAPTWDLGRTDPVPMRRWGKDHWTTFAYVETRWVDHRGMLDHDRMRCDRQRHPAFYAAKRRTAAFGTDVDGTRYPTRLKTETPDADGNWGTVELPGHDDYDCLDDAIREGLIEVAMPRPHDGIFLDAWDRPVRVPGGEVVGPSLVTGLAEMWLMTAASFSLTERGQGIAGELRAHMAATRTSHQFMPAEAVSLQSEHLWVYRLSCGDTRTSMKREAPQDVFLREICTHCPIHGDTEVVEEIPPTGKADYTDAEYREFGKWLVTRYGDTLKPDGTDASVQRFDDGIEELAKAYSLSLPFNYDHPVIKGITKAYRAELRAKAANTG